MSQVSPKIIFEAIRRELPPLYEVRARSLLVGPASTIDIVADPIIVTVVQRGSFTRFPPAAIDISLNQSVIADRITVVVTILGTWLNLNIIVDPIVVVVTQHGTGPLGKLFSDNALILVTVSLSADAVFASPKRNWLKWSNIGALDFTVWRDNIAGERPTDWKGWIYEIKKLGTKIIVYGQSGISLLTPAGNAFGFQTIYRLGLLSKQAVIGDDSVHFFIDSESRLCKFDTSIEVLDYSEYLVNLVNPVMSQDVSTNLIYMCDGVIGFVYNPIDKSLGSCPGNITGIVFQQGVRYIAASAAISSPSLFEICTDIYDMGSRWGKTIRSIEVGTNVVTPVSVCIDYRVNKNAAFQQTRWRVVNHRGIAFLPCYGNEFRFRAKAASYEYFELDYIKVIGVTHDN